MFIYDLVMLVIGWTTKTEMGGLIEPGGVNGPTNEMGGLMEPNG